MNFIILFFFLIKKNDSTDISLGKIIRSKLADGLELLPPNFKRITHGQYRFGTRKIYISLQNNQPVVRVGGGYMIFTSFVKKYGRSECIKTNRAGLYIHLIDRIFFTRVDYLLIFYL